MNLAKTSLLTFISTAIKLLAGLVINKAVAVFIGPSGVALIGQFQSFSQIAMTLAKGGINNGVTKYTAEYDNDSINLVGLFSTAARISLACSVIVAVALIVLSPWLSQYFLKSAEYTYIFIVLGFTVVLFVLNNLLLSILNGLKEIKTFVKINIIQSIYSLIFTSLLIVLLGLDGALLAMVTNQSVIFVIVLYLLRKHERIKLNFFTQPFNNNEAKKLFHYALMALASAVTMPVAHLLVRNYLGDNLGWDQAGYWQAMWYISSMYLMVVTTSLGIYYLPRLSEINNKAELRKEIFDGYKIILPIVTAMSLAIYILKDIIIGVLFTSEFHGMRELFLWQLIGDVIKIGAWVLSYVMLAKAMTRTFIWTEILFSITFVLLSFYFVSNFGLVGMSYAHATNYTIYLIFMIFLIKGKMF